VVAIKKRKKKRIHRIYRKEKSVELSKQVNAPAEIIWSVGWVLHRKRAFAHAHSEERQTALLLPSVRPCKKRKITMMMIYEKERK